MRNIIKKAPAEFQEDLLYFQHFMQILYLLEYLKLITNIRS